MTTTATTEKPNQQIATRPMDMSGIEIAGSSSRNPAEITARIRQAMETANFIGPMTQCPTLPEGCEIAFSTVMVDTDLDKKEVYSIGGELGLHKVVLNKIKMAVGVRWDKAASGRLDNGSDPHYCHYKAYGYVRKYDGTEDTIEGDEAIDLRSNSALCEEIIALKVDKALDKLAKDLKDREPNANERQNAINAATRAAEGDIRKKRIKILRLAQTSAQNAAIRSLGIKHSYTKEELDSKPFVIGTLVYTGRSDNPEIAMRNADRIADHFLGSRAQLYAQPEHAAPNPANANTGYAPPPVHSGSSIEDLANVIDADEGDDENGNGNGSGQHQEATGTATAKTETAKETVAADSGQQALPVEGEAIEPPSVDFVVKFGRTKDTKISEHSLSQLSSLFDFYQRSIDDPGKERFRSANEAAMKTITAWIDYRRATGGDKKKQAPLY